MNENNYFCTILLLYFVLINIIISCARNNLDLPPSEFIDTSSEGLEEDDNPIVETKLGLLKGKNLLLKSGKSIQQFLGIRYAQSPVGELRFKPPLPAEAWAGMQIAQEYGPACMQRDTFRKALHVNGDEDCLFLNIYTSLSANMSNLPVMVYLHGGGFLCGAGSWYLPDFLMEHPIVLVTLNYRLGAFGFLSMGDKVLPGNYGLKDQNLALRWIRDNIEAFNGNPHSITIFGSSAGAVSVTLHLASTKSDGLFHRAIAMGGSLNVPWGMAHNKRHIRYARKLSRLFSCHTESSTKMLHCLRKIPARSIVEADVQFMKWDIDPVFIFTPVVEDPDDPDAFITRYPYTQCGFDFPVPLIIGITTHEGSLRVPWIFTSEGLLEDFDKNFNTIAPISLFYGEIAYNIQKTNYKIKKFYFDDKPITQESKDQVIKLFSDAWVNAGVKDTVDCFKQSTNKTIYFYLFGFKGSSSLTKIYGDISNNGEFGVAHGDENLYLFPLHENLFPEIERTAEDKQMINTLTQMWVNFATLGDPTPKVTDYASKRWLPLYSADMQYYNIGQDGVDMKTALYADRFKFWKKIFQDTSLYVVEDET